MQDHVNQQQSNQQTGETQQENKTAQIGGDYIDFEEVK
jgi:hypothetical protein